MPVIKRYANRKLYDTLTRHYVTLEQIGWMIQNGEDVRVIDHETEADITVVTLTQVIFDLEKRLGGFFPQVFLSNLVKNRNTSHPFFHQWSSFFLKQDDLVNEEITRRLKILADENEINDEEFRRISVLLTDERFSWEEENGAATAEQLDDLKQQLKSLEDELARIKQDKKES